MRAKNKLSAIQVKTLGPGEHSDGDCLWLRKREDGGSQWVLRYNMHKRRHEMGLGSGQDVTLKEARQLAEHWNKVKRSGKDPIKERKRLEREAERDDHTLRRLAEETFETRKAELKGDGKAGRWFSPP